MCSKKQMEYKWLGFIWLPPKARLPVTQPEPRNSSSCTGLHSNLVSSGLVFLHSGILRCCEKWGIGLLRTPLNVPVTPSFFPVCITASHGNNSRLVRKRIGSGLNHWPESPTRCTEPEAVIHTLLLFSTHWNLIVLSSGSVCTWILARKCVWQKPDLCTFAYSTIQKCGNWRNLNC